LGTHRRGEIPERGSAASERFNRNKNVTTGQSKQEAGYRKQEAETKNILIPET
jgi:hypothetical protein